jgi:hypothetical protein
VSDGEEGAVLLPEDLDWFEGYDAGTVVGRQEANDEVHLEVHNGHTNDPNSG